MDSLQVPQWPLAGILAQAMPSWAGCSQPLCWGPWSPSRQPSLVLGTHPSSHRWWKGTAFPSGSMSFAWQIPNSLLPLGFPSSEGHGCWSPNRHPVIFPLQAQSSVTVTRFTLDGDMGTAASQLCHSQEKALRSNVQLATSFSFSQSDNRRTHKS